MFEVGVDIVEGVTVSSGDPLMTTTPETLVRLHQVCCRLPRNLTGFEKTTVVG